MKKTLSLMALGLCFSPVANAKHKPMTMDCSQPMHATMSFCKQQAAEQAAQALPKETAQQASMVDHSKMDHSTMNHVAMTKEQAPTKTVDHSKMNHATMTMGKAPDKVPAKTMDHSKMNHAAAPAASIPVSDGSMAEDVPMPFPGAMHMDDDPVLSKLMINALEYRFGDNNENSLALDAEAWVGKDLNKLWLKADIESEDGEIAEAELQALYSRAIAPFWDFQVGVRKDFEPVSREWAVLGLKGTAPYQLDVDASLFFGKGGQVGARLNTEYELMLSQKTSLVPELGANFYTKDDQEAGIGSGLSDLDISLRLKHELKREFAPYIGINWSKSFGNKADMLKQSGEKTSDTQLALGVEAWF